MSGRDPALATKARALAQAFDRSFAEARATSPPPLLDFLAVRVGGDAYAIALADIAGLVPRGRLTPLPNTPPECLGVAGLRGVVTPAYDLCVLLGYSTGAGAGRWLAVIAGARAALAFDEVEGFLRLREEALAGPGDAQRPRRHVSGALQSNAVVRPVIDMGSIVQSIGAMAGLNNASSE
ncbi:chemotaxis protein CheW [Phenylobacterium sp.]|uniref:chemotaxis protein CheW n=1 Tax=Phenylobacterium sp. TaxID=1871053 RepID=UPI0027369B8D|nr:chemotaxis protein CheW [Phenylobacterium sp.]MDP3852762.1 chemotaxis protein CheW [Phenylobacterium sp.]